MSKIHLRAKKHSVRKYVNKFFIRINTNTAERRPDGVFNF